MVKINAGGGSRSLRDWACPSYDVKTGRSASSLQETGTGSKGNHTTSVADQKGATAGVTAMDKSGSADTGRRKYGGSDLP